MLGRRHGMPHHYPTPPTHRGHVAVHDSCKPSIQPPRAGQGASHAVPFHEQLWPLCQQVVPSPGEQVPHRDPAAAASWHIYAAGLLVLKQDFQAATACWLRGRVGMQVGWRAGAWGRGGGRAHIDAWATIQRPPT